MTRTSVLVAALALAGCNQLLGGELDVEFDVRVESVDTTPTDVTCGVVVTATATGTDGETARIGEAEWTLVSVADGSELGGERVSAAFMGQNFFRTSIIPVGSSVQSSLFQRSASAAFEWRFTFHYRKPSGFREERSAVVTCQ